MAMMFRRFEIQSELSQSETASIYKALDTKSNQVVALKTQSLEALGDRADKFVNTLLAEGESTRDLASQNIVVLYGAGEIDNQFCAAMEYIQGNSVATMVARNEGFSIWDLLDITRQVCAGLEYAAAKGVAHHSLEPAKIMVQWDGMVKILGYGISNMGLIEAEAGNGLGRLMPYCSPEQIRGEAIDLRSNLFTLGAILYEMMVGRPAFSATDPVMLVNLIESHTPPSPSSVNAKIQPAVSALIMKALAKDPAERYQSARELLVDLENCKDTGKKAAPETRKPAPAPAVAVDPAARSAAASKFTSIVAGATKSEPAVRAVPSKPTAAIPPSVNAVVPSQTAPPAARVKAAAAGATSGAIAAPLSNSRVASNLNYKSDSASDSSAHSTSGPKSDSSSGARLISDFDVSAFESHAAPNPVMSAAVVERESETHTPRAVDPMMAEPAVGSSRTSFSDLAEMPPLKEPVFTPPVPEPVELPDSPQRQVTQIYPRKDQKPRTQPREVAEKAMQQIATIPPRLMLFSILGAVGLILIIAIAVFLRVRSDDDSTAAPRPVKVVRPDQPGVSTQVAPRIEKPAPPVAPILETKPRLTVRQIEKHPANVRRVAAPAAVPVVVTGQALIESTPQGAQFQVDGKSDPLWVTPFSVAGLNPGKHIISASKTGYAAEIRSVDVVAGNQASLVFHLAAVNALVVVNSTPAGADVVIDGRTTGRVTPAQFAVEKGSHTVLLRKQGYLDETVTTDLGPGQNFQYSPVLKALGNAADMRTVGKFNKLFGHGGDSTAAMGAISVHTQPKGAQVAINQRILDRTSPVDVMLGPGNYIVDITLTGFKPVHKVVNVDKGGKAVVDEIMERQ